MVRSSLLDAVIGLLALTTVTSTRPSPAPSVTRAATPMPATSVAQTSAIATTFKWVMRSAPSIEKLFMSSPSPEAPCFIGRAGPEKGSWGLPEKNGEWVGLVGALDSSKIPSNLNLLRPREVVGTSGGGTRSESHRGVRWKLNG